MKRLSMFLSLLLMVSTIFCGKAHSQTETGPWHSQTVWTGNNTEISGDLTTMTPKRTVTAQELAIENRILEIKRTGNGTREDIIHLQNQLDNITGINATVQTTPIPGSGLEQVHSQPPFQQDLGRTEILSTGTNVVSGMVTFTEQNSNNAGRLWACVAFRTTNNPDSLRLYNSTDNGVHWNLVVNGWLGGTNSINYDQMDMEVIANGDSAFVWVTFGYRVNASGDWRCGGMVIRPSPFGGTIFSINWPGTSSNNRYYRPRITSDNAQFGTLAYLYVIASYDSVTSAPGRRNGQKYARVLDPYVTSTPTFSYYGPVFFWNTSVSDGNMRDLHSDIAYFRNNTSDSIIVSYSNMRDSTKLFFSKCGIGTPSPQSAGGQLGGSQPTLHKQYASLSSNGNNNGSIMCIFRQFAGGSEWDVRYFRTINYGNFSEVASESVLLPRSSTSNAYPPMIVGVRNSIMHYFVFRVDSSPDSIAFTRVNGINGAWDPDNVDLNHGGLTTLSGSVFPQPGFRYASGDSCFAIYPTAGPYDMYATTGCSGTVTSVHNNQIPGKYSLLQNYPNPFNPSTSIRFEIPKDGLVKLVVYDVLGKEVATLINDKRTAGTYLVDFNATGLSSGVYFYKLITSDFTDVKKMTLIK